MALITQSDVSVSSNPSSPVQYDNFSREFQNVVTQDNFDGFRLEAGKAVNKYLQASHSLLLGTQLKDCGYIYQFGPTFSLDNGSLIMMARWGIDRTVNARVVKKIGKNFEAKSSFNSSLDDPQKNMFEFSCDNVGDDWASSIKLAHQGMWIVNGAFSQVLSARLQVGGEITWITGNGASIGSVGVRYAGAKNTVIGQFSRQPDFKSPCGFAQNNHNSKFQFVRKVSDRLSLAAEYEQAYPDLESGLKLGCEYLFRHARVQSLLDTSGKVSVFAQDFSGFGISGVIDYVRSDYKFGFMMHVLPSADSTR